MQEVPDLVAQPAAGIMSTPGAHVEHRATSHSSQPELRGVR